MSSIFAEVKSSSRSRNALIFLLFLGALVFQMLQSLGFDNSIMHAMAYQWWAFDRLPYLGTWDQNFPGIVYVHYLGILLSGPNEYGFRMLDILAHAINAYLAYRILRHWLSDRVAIGAGIVGIALYYSGGTYLAGQRDAFAATGILLAVLILLHSREPGQRQTSLYNFISGFGLAFALSIRPTYVLFAAIVTCCLWRYTPAGLKNALYLVLGGVLGTLVCFYPFITDPTAFDAFIQACYQFNVDIYGTTKYNLPILRALRQPPELLNNLAMLTLVFCAFPSIASKLRAEGFRTKLIQDCVRIPTRREWIMLALLYLSLRIPIWLMGKFMVYHYEPTLIVMSAGMAIGCAGIANYLSGKRRLAFWVGIVAFYLICLPWPLISTATRSIIDDSSEGMLRSTYLTQGPEGHGVKEEMWLAGYLNQKGDSESVTFFTIQGAPAWRVHRPLSSRFHTFFALGMRKPDGGFTDYQRAWHKEVANSLTSRKPKYVVVGVNPPTAPFIERAPVFLLPEIPEIKQALDKNYVKDTMIGYWEVLRRR